MPPRTPPHARAGAVAVAPQHERSERQRDVTGLPATRADVLTSTAGPNTTAGRWNNPYSWTRVAHGDNSEL